ncbi:MAG TPA: FkbM family methyltransferase [Verrucomicrobiales bacterium]|jgi:FkbM family methyltransferase|nr:FkbM family methyltransferase [Verrucomicrobiales bacterium]
MKTSFYGFNFQYPLRRKGIGQWLAAYGSREPDQLFVLAKILKEGDVVIDLGANFGYYALVESRLVGRTGKVIAIEPDPRNLEYLNINLAVNHATDLVAVHGFAASDRDGDGVFLLGEWTNLSSLQASTKPRRKYVGDWPVKLRNTGKFILSCEQPIALLRMDVEGHEAFILKSLITELEDHPDRLPRHIVFEPHAWEYTGSNQMTGNLRMLLSRWYHVSFMSTKLDPAGSLGSLGYEPCHTMRYFDRTYALYSDVKAEHAIHEIVGKAGVTTVCLSKS